jgi:hypothetical protein
MLESGEMSLPKVDMARGAPLRPVAYVGLRDGTVQKVLGATREARVAKAIGGAVSRDQIVNALYGRTDIDVIAPNGDLVMVGGPAKAKDLSHLGKVIKNYQAEAEKRGVAVKAHFAAGTPKSILDFVAKRLGAENVVIFEE